MTSFYLLDFIDLYLLLLIIAIMHFYHLHSLPQQDTKSGIKENDGEEEKFAWIRQSASKRVSFDDAELMVFYKLPFILSWPGLEFMSYV